MILSPYESSACKYMDLTKVLGALAEELIENRLAGGPSFYEVMHRSTEVPIFTQPVTARQFGNRRVKPEVVVDARSYTRATRDTGEAITYANHAEAEFQQLRAKLQIIWQNDRPVRTDLLQIGEIPGQAFVAWVGRTLGGKLGLDPEQQMIVNVVCAYYYINLFYTEEQFDEQVKNRSAQVISRWTRIQAGQVLEIIDKLGYLANANEFVGALHVCVDSPRIKQVELAFLFAVLNGSWFGINGRETVCVALEHPPTFIALCHAALGSRSFKNYVLAKVVQNQVRGGNDKTFVNALATVLKHGSL